MLVLLGAGASKPIGVPTTFEFPGVLRDRLHAQFEGPVRAFWDLCETTFGQTLDLETLLTFFDDCSRPHDQFVQSISPVTGRLIYENPNVVSILRESIEKGSFKAASDMIRDALREIMIPIQEERVRLALSIYDRFFYLLSRNRPSSYKTGDGAAVFPNEVLSIFTTNYDKFVEVYLNRRRVRYESGVVRVTGQNLFDFKRFDVNRSQVEVVKLHGSIDWYRTASRNIIEWDFPITKRAEFGKYPAPLGDGIREEILLYPTEHGGDRRLLLSPYADMYELLRTRFKQEDTVIVVGFSFRDERLASLMDDVLRWSEGSPKKILFVDPRSEKIKQDLEQRGYTALAQKLKLYPIPLDHPNLASEVQDGWR